LGGRFRGRVMLLWRVMYGLCCRRTKQDILWPPKRRYCLVGAGVVGYDITNGTIDLSIAMKWPKDRFSYRMYPPDLFHLELKAVGTALDTPPLSYLSVRRSLMGL